MLPKSGSQPLPATLAQSRNLAHAPLETAVGLATRRLSHHYLGAFEYEKLDIFRMKTYVIGHQRCRKMR